jgi:DNA polymerase-3 subunit delta'
MIAEEDNPTSDKIVGAPHPKLAKKLIGHSTQKLYFLNSYISDRLPQCWLLTGDMGVGKATFAWIIAKFLLTTNQGPDDIKVDLNGSNIDSILAPQDGGTLTRIISGSDQRIYVVRKGYNEKTKAFFKNISIDDIRNLQSYCSLSIADGGRRVIIIDTADDLNTNSCNALLKLLEEPPKNTLFLLISHQPNLLLPTLQSRCQKLSFAALGQNDLRAVLTTIGWEIDPTEEVSLSILSNGSAGVACRLINSNCLNLYGDILNLASSLPKINTKKAMQLSQNYFAKGKGSEFESFIEMMQQFFSRLCKTGAMQRPILPSVTIDEAKIMTNLCPSLSSAHLWSEAAEITLAKLHKGYLLNIDVESLIIDTFIYLEKCYNAIDPNRMINE